MTSFSCQKWYGIADNQWNLKENILIFTVSIVPANGLAHLGARAYAGKVMTKLGPCIHAGPTNRALTYPTFILQELHGVLADLAVDIGRLCFDGNLTYTKFNHTMAFEERVIDGGTFVAGPISRGANTCTMWPSDQYFIPVLESKGMFIDRTTLGPEHYNRRYMDDIFECVFFIDNIIFPISLQFVHRSRIGDKSQIYHWCWLWKVMVILSQLIFNGIW